MNKNIPIPDDAYKPELLELGKKNKETVPFACAEILNSIIGGFFYTSLPL